MMIDRHLEARVDAWIAAHKQELVDETCELVSIESIADPSAQPGPFGKGCRDVLDLYLKIGGRHGLAPRNFEYYAGELYRPESAGKERRIGLLAHLDVVPAGDGWAYPPFEPRVIDGLIIGRGSQDNKGAAMAAMYTVLCLRDLGVELRHDVCALVGMNEENGMQDMKYYVEHCERPYFILVTDSGFPVCYGEKGSLSGRFVSEKPLSEQILSLTSGTMAGQVPDSASIVLAYSPALEEKLAALSPGDDCAWERGEQGFTLRAKGIGGHISFPGNRHALHALAKSLIEHQLLDDPYDREVFAFASRATDGSDGAAIGIASSDEESGALVFGCGVAGLEEGHLHMAFRSRCPVSADTEALLSGMESLAKGYGVGIRDGKAMQPLIFCPRDKPQIQRLNQVLCDITGGDWQPQVFGAGTHARVVPNAVPYGPGGLMRYVKPFFQLPPGHGGAHQPDEGQSVDALCLALKAYILGVAAIDTLDLSADEGAAT